MLPLEVRPETGEVVVEPVDPDGTPELRVRPGAATGDEVVWRYHATVSGHRYVLESVSAGTERDSAVASSPVDLLDDDSSELLRIFDDGETSTSDSDNPPGGGPVSAGVSWIESTPVLLGSVLLGLVGAAYAARRWLAPWQQVAVVAGGAVVALLVAGEAVSSEPVLARLVEPVGRGLGEAAPLVVLGALVLAGYAVYKRVGGSRGPTVEIRGRFRR